MAVLSKGIVFQAAALALVPCGWKVLNKGDHFEVAEPRVVIYLMPRMRA